MFINKLVVISLLSLIRYRIDSFTLQPFYWNQTTFRSYQNDSLMFEVHLGDVMDLICPFYDEQEQSYLSNELEQYEIYHVTKDEYDKCRLNRYDLDSITRLVIACNNPYDVMKYTLNFRSYLPIPNGLEFHSNETYYFLSTSSTHQQCQKLRIIVHEYHRILPSSTTVPHHRHLFAHVNKVQRHSDPYSIKWITERPRNTSNMLRLALTSSSSKLSLSSLFAMILLVLLR